MHGLLMCSPVLYSILLWDYFTKKPHVVITKVEMPNSLLTMVSGKKCHLQKSCQQPYFLLQL